MTINTPNFLERKATNVLQSFLIMAGMFLLLALVGWSVAGPEGVVMLSLVGGAALWLSPRVAPAAILRRYRAFPLSYRSRPDAHELAAAISERAGLPEAPRLFHVPSNVSNAFALGCGDQACIGITDGILSRFSSRELAGILAHEISHIRNRDTVVMGMADAVGRFTSVLSNMGLLLLFFNLPMFLLGGYQFPWMLVVVLNSAPLVSGLLQLGLSRTREFNADLEAARLTGDPRGLAMALDKIERLQTPWWQRLFFPGHRPSEPSLLRSHPPTGERIERLLELEAPVPAVEDVLQRRTHRPTHRVSRFSPQVRPMAGTRVPGWYFGRAG